MKSINLSDLKQFDCTLILTDHSDLPYEYIVKESTVVIDTRNSTQGMKGFNNIILI